MINTVVDLSHHNVISDFDKIKNDGVAGIIHKATEGFSFKDRKYSTRQKKWQDEMRMLWGAYHFASPGDGVKQADHFLKTIFPSGIINPHTLLVLDYEQSQSGGLMSIPEAERFVQRIFERAGRWPGLYSGADIKHAKMSGELKENSILKNCWLWIAQYGPRPKNIPYHWPTWTMWQYTDGTAGPSAYSKKVNGIGPCDRDLFNGSPENLLKLWDVPADSVSDIAFIKIADLPEDVA